MHILGLQNHFFFFFRLFIVDPSYTIHMDWHILIITFIGLSSRRELFIAKTWTQKKTQLTHWVKNSHPSSRSVCLTTPLRQVIYNYWSSIRMVLLTLEPRNFFLRNRPLLFCFNSFTPKQFGASLSAPASTFQQCILQCIFLTNVHAIHLVGFVQIFIFRLLCMLKGDAVCHIW